MLRQRWILGIILGIFVLVAAPIQAVVGPEGADGRAPRPGKPRYVEGELIVKFKEVAANSIEEQLGQSKGAKELRLTSSLDELTGKHRVQKFEPVVKDFKAKRQRIKDLLKKDRKKLTKREKHLLRRLKRAPRGAKVPDLGRIYKIELEEGESAVRAVSEYNKDPDVEYAQLNYIMSAYASPNDPNYSPEQWALNNTGQSYPRPYGETGSGTAGCDVNAPEAWDIQTGSSDIIIAVIDSGVDYNHLDLQNNMWTDANGCYGYDFVADDNDPMDDHYHGHGTHCAGIIAADGNNSTDVVGICWDANIMAVKFLNAGGSGTTADAVSAIEYATDNGADILSNSWGPSVRLPSNPAAEEAVDYAYDSGCVVVFAAGNSNADVADYSPANYYKTIAVGATESNDVRAYFSNYGDSLDVVAPGVDILSLRGPNATQCPYRYYPYNDSNATMYILSGTSMACPYVSGLAALLLSEDANLTNTSVEVLIACYADDIEEPNDSDDDDHFGFGRINAHAALNNMPTDSNMPRVFNVNKRAFN